MRNLSARRCCPARTLTRSSGRSPRSSHPGRTPQPPGAVTAPGTPAARRSDRRLVDTASHRHTAEIKGRQPPMTPRAQPQQTPLHRPGQLHPERLPTPLRRAHQAPHPHLGQHSTRIYRNIQKIPPVVPVHPIRTSPAIRARSPPLWGPCPHHDLDSLIRHVFYEQRRQPENTTRARSLTSSTQHQRHQSLSVTTGSETEPNVLQSPPVTPHTP